MEVDSAHSSMIKKNINKKLSYRRGTARCVMSVEIPANCHATVHKLMYDKS